MFTHIVSFAESWGKLVVAIGVCAIIIILVACAYLYFVADDESDDMNDLPEMQEAQPEPQPEVQGPKERKRDERGRYVRQG